MKNISRSLTLAFAGILAAAFIFSGCAGPEHRRTTGQYFDDQAVNARVKTALLQDEVVAGFDVSTTTFDGVVQLSGFVDNQDQQARAEEVARDVSGVQEVINNITVNPRAPQFGSPGDADEPPMEDQPRTVPEPRT